MSFFFINHWLLNIIKHLKRILTFILLVEWCSSLSSFAKLFFSCKEKSVGWFFTHSNENKGDCWPYFLLFSESIYRRGARRWRKLYYANGHAFQAKRFNRVRNITRIPTLFRVADLWSFWKILYISLCIKCLLIYILWYCEFTVLKVIILY